MSTADHEHSHPHDKADAQTPPAGHTHAAHDTKPDAAAHGHGHAEHQRDAKPDAAGHGHGHGHAHYDGLLGKVKEIFVPHSHDSSDKIDSALEASKEGMRCLKISFVGLIATALIQTVVVFLTNSVALLGDTLHNYADALTAIPSRSPSSSAAASRPARTPMASAAPRTWPASSWSC